MSETFTLSGSAGSKPVVGAPSGQGNLSIPLDEGVSLLRSLKSEYRLSADAVQAVGLGPLTNVHVLIVRANGGKVRVRVTSADGVTQAIPVDPLLVLIANDVPITAVDLTRVANIETDVSIFLGERA